MLCRQCEESIKGTGCTRNGVCGKNAALAEGQDALTGALIALCRSYSDDGYRDRVESLVVDGLFMTLTNTNFDPVRISEAKGAADALRSEMSLGSEGMGFSIQSLDDNDDLRCLKELLLYGIRGLAAYYHHARVLGGRDDSVFGFIMKGMSALADPLTADELVALNMECGTVGVTCLALLDGCNTGRYGNPEITSVSTGVGSNPGILITGHDLLDLEMLLEQTSGTGIDVYTHGEMLPAHAYPFFKKYPHFIGNYGGAWYRQKEEFDSFNGPVIATTNCVLIPGEGYRDRLYTTGTAGVEGVAHIPEVGGVKDFSAAIERARSCEPPTPIEGRDLTIGFAHGQVLALADKIIDAVKSGAIKRFVVMAGCDGRESARLYYADFASALPDDAVILTAGCAKYRYNGLDLGDIGGIPRVIDAGQCNDCYSLVVIANALAQAFDTDVNGLPLSFNISWYEQKAVLVLLSLLSLGVKDIMLGPRLPVFVTPGILNVLVDAFGIKANSDVEGDIRILNIA
ncbi:MAG: hydroxylamine reductase [Candidatus Methanomethylophilaceae archaeon]|nr:hydroxylamine reductase [Candidatus Methanomethylophilaceae archaeon]